MPAPEWRSSHGWIWARQGSSSPGLIAPISATVLHSNTAPNHSCCAFSKMSTHRMRESSIACPAKKPRMWLSGYRSRVLMPCPITPACRPPHERITRRVSCAKKGLLLWLPSPLAWVSTNLTCASWRTWTCPRQWKPTTRKPVGPAAMANPLMPG